MDSRHGAMRWIAAAWAIAGILGLAVRCAAARGDTAPPARMRRNPRVALFGMALYVLTGSVSARAMEPSKSAAAFDHLASLVGGWRGIQSGTEFQVTYTLTADGSALMEEFRPKGGATMVTMFTVDGDHLIATHYCSAKNQPQMVSTAIADPRAKSVAFSLVRVTGLKTPDDWHNTGLVLTMEDQDHLTQEWTYLFKGETGKTLFHLTRVH